MVHIGICDDEKGTCAEIESMLCRYGKMQRISIEVSVWYTGENLCKFLKGENTLDILFLDIDLISTDGIKVGNFIREELENIDTIIIYISSRSSYAMNLFRVQPFDFLIKPLNFTMIEDLMKRCLKLYDRRNHLFQYYSKGSFFKIPYRNIIYFYSQNKAIYAVLPEKEISFNGKLKKLAENVPPNFLLIHQSYLINLDFMIECNYDKVKMKNGTLLNISQPYRKKVRNQIVKNEWENLNNV